MYGEYVESRYSVSIKRKERQSHIFTHHAYITQMQLAGLLTTVMRIMCSFFFLIRFFFLSTFFDAHKQLLSREREEARVNDPVSRLYLISPASSTFMYSNALSDLASSFPLPYGRGALQHVGVKFGQSASKTLSQATFPTRTRCINRFVQKLCPFMCTERQSFVKSGETRFRTRAKTLVKLTPLVLFSIFSSSLYRQIFNTV